MKGSTANKILKVYKVAGVVLAVIIGGGGILTLIISGLIENWIATLCFLGALALLIGIAALGIEADVSKHNPD